MSALLKSGSAQLVARVRPFGRSAPSPEPVPDPERERLEAELAALQCVVAERDDAIARHRDELEAECQAAEARGRDTGREDADERAADRLAALREGVTGALDKFAGALGGIEQLALLLARTCLEQMLLATDARTALVAELLRGRIRTLENQAILRIRVSATDFESADALGDIAAGCEIEIADTLAPGACTIVLRLGALEIGLDRQWEALRSTLDEMIGEASAR